MATPRKRTTRVKAVADENYSKLDQYAIEIHEFYKSLRKAGFTVDNALWLASTKECYPEWMQKNITINDVTQYLEDEEDE
jgi:hypothetical protein